MTMLCRGIQDRQVMVESSDKTWPTGEGNGKPLQFSCLENPMNSMKRQKDRHWKMNSPGCYIFPNMLLEKSGETAPKRIKRLSQSKKQHPVVDVTGDGSKVWCCKDQYCIGTWNVRSMNQGQLEVVKQEMARVNIHILGINELKWTGMDKFN